MTQSTVPMHDPMLPRSMTIQSVRRETDDTFSIALKPGAGRKGFRFAPGQFNMLYIFGVGEIPISISGDPQKPALLEHTTRAVGTVTKQMQKLRRGDTIGVRGPYGSGWPVEEAVGRDVVLVAGGIGLAPLRPVIHELMNRRAEFNRVVLLYGARSPDDILYQRDLQRWRSQFDFEVHVTVDRGTRDWRGNVGVVTHLIRRAPFRPDQSLAMICGPEVMMRFAVQELQRRGVREELAYVSMERNMKCAIGFCGHCQYGPEFICKDGPVFPLSRVGRLLNRWEL